MRPILVISHFGPFGIGRKLHFFEVLGLGQNLQEETVYDQIIVGHILITHRTIPRGLLLVHHEIGLDVEALHVFTLVRAARQIEPELHEGTLQRDFVRIRLNLEIRVAYLQLFAHHFARYFCVFGAVDFEVFHQAFHAHFAEQIDAHTMHFVAFLVCPAQLYFVGDIWCQAAYGCDVY